MKKIKGIALIVGISATLALILGCGGGSEANSTDASGASTEATVSGETAATGLVGEGQPEATREIEPGFAVVTTASVSSGSRPGTPPLLQSGRSQGGIWVTARQPLHWSRMWHC